MLGGYGKIANPQSSLDTYFAVIQKELEQQLLRFVEQHQGKTPS